MKMPVPQRPGAVVRIARGPRRGAPTSSLRRRGADHPSQGRTRESKVATERRRAPGHEPLHGGSSPRAFSMPLPREVFTSYLPAQMLAAPSGHAARASCTSSRLTGDVLSRQLSAETRPDEVTSDSFVIDDDRCCPGRRADTAGRRGVARQCWRRRRRRWQPKRCDLPRSPTLFKVGSTIALPRRLGSPSPHRSAGLQAGDLRCLKGRSSSASIQ